MLRISRIEVDNFKSLVGFEADLPKFACLIGLNGSGKSTVLQLFEFLSQLVRGDMRDWLKMRQWKADDIRCKLTYDRGIQFRVSFADGETELEGGWAGRYDPSAFRCQAEECFIRGQYLRVRFDVLKIVPPPEEWGANETPIAFDYQGSILSALKARILPQPIRDCKSLLEEIKSLDLLVPDRLRQRNRESTSGLGPGGQNLSSVLHGMREPTREGLMRKVREIYPHLEELRTKSVRSGWKQLEIQEKYQGDEQGSSRHVTTEAHHINDGMLRLIAILAELQSDSPFLLFDEIENGINPEVVQFLVNELVSTPKQVLITTHSPMILNYLDDETARRGVIYLYKTRQGFTRAIPFFSIPSIAEKLTMMGPGEAFADTCLTELADEIAGMPEGNL